MDHLVAGFQTLVYGIPQNMDVAFSATELGVYLEIRICKSTQPLNRVRDIIEVAMTQCIESVADDKHALELARSGLSMIDTPVVKGQPTECNLAVGGPFSSGV